MPAFCRHSRLLQNCPICTREQNVAMAPVVSSSTPKVSEPRTSAAKVGGGSSQRLGGTEKTTTSRSSRSGGVKVRKLQRGAEDGYTSRLVQGLKSSADAEQLAFEIAFAATRLLILAADPPGPYAEIAASGDIEERTWRAVQVSFGTGEDSWVSWASGEGLAPYRGWVARIGSQQAAFTGEDYWPAERRFERVFERLGSIGVIPREPRFDLLVVLGQLGLYEFEAGKLLPGGENETTWAAKRAFGIGDQLLLERRAADLAAAAGVPLAALDLGLHNWGKESPQRDGRGIDPELEPDADLLAGCRRALAV